MRQRDVNPANDYSGGVQHRFLKRLKDLARNGRWGECSDCAAVDPGLCVNTNRFDHQLTPQSLSRLIDLEILKARAGLVP